MNNFAMHVHSCKCTHNDFALYIVLCVCVCVCVCRECECEYVVVQYGITL